MTYFHRNTTIKAGKGQIWCGYTEFHGLLNVGRVFDKPGLDGIIYQPVV